MDVARGDQRAAAFVGIGLARRGGGCLDASASLAPACAHRRSSSLPPRIVRRDTACRCRERPCTITPSLNACGDVERGRERRPARHAHQQSFLARQPPRQVPCPLRRHPQVLVGQQRDRRSPDESRSPCASALRRRASASRAGPRSGGWSDRCSRSRRPTPMNVPLVPRPATKWVRRPSVCSRISGAVVVVVRAPVGVVVVLVGVEVSGRVLGEQAPRLADGAVGALHRIGEHDLGAERAQGARPAPASRWRACTA